MLVLSSCWCYRCVSSIILLSAITM